jgi:hypothetical protein
LQLFQSSSLRFQSPPLFPPFAAWSELERTLDLNRYWL